MDVTFIILTKDEESNITDCLRSTEGFAARTIVVDSGSTDRTCELARAEGAEVVTHPFENYAMQWNWALDNLDIRTAWTFRLDADERLTPALIRELELIAERSEGTDINGITMEAWLYFLGRCIRHGGHKKRKLMMFRTGKARIENRRMDEHTVLLEGRAVPARERFIHYDFRDLSYFIRKMNWYATREMQDYLFPIATEEVLSDPTIARTRKRKFGIYYRFPMFFRSWLLFLYFYIFRLGFLDGREGYLYHYFYQRWYRLLVDAKIYEQRKTNRPPEVTGDLK